MNAVGIDVSKEKSMAVALRPMGEVALLPQEFLHTEVGLEQMAYAIIALGEDTRIVMEANGHYKCSLPTLFEKTAAEQNIRHKLIRPYTPRHNGKAERSHREDQKRFYSCRSFYSLDDFVKQLSVHNRRSNNLPMRPLRWMSPAEVSVQYV